MDSEQNLAPALRYIATAIVLGVSLPLLLVIKTVGRGDPGLSIFSMALIGAIAIGLIVALNNDRAKNKVIKLPKFRKPDNFVS